MVPENLKYASSHEWVREEGEELIVIGITAHLADQLSEVIYVELPDPGDDVLPDTPFGEIELEDKEYPLYAPLEGRVVETNTGLAEQPEMLQNDPYGGAWMIKVRPDGKTFFDQLLSPPEYQALIGTLDT